MTIEEIFQLINANPAFHLATVEGDQPRCRGMFLYRADGNGIIFHSGSMKDVHKQIAKNPKVEMCFNDFKNGVQVRVAGTLEIVEDKVLKDEICEHPSRKFLKDWRESGTLDDFYNSFKVYRLKGGKAVSWTMETNFAPKVEIVL
ncbi:pyridoxamine 5'-phosphate oxidase [candidate division WOR-1 bacterium RIFOXYC2_FULL_37_10]|uniref:Pyridoxamine 5'-phosphate oxidase n=1 Tax=candidate division WOR-1 bacterium RIFOXYB2_FULL_37_13 TaxID=1802579 RepID=A0A1F4SDX0_UNCSA|nr:MAG: pyridoxamine 5'-phosphate oxidase [candidate division WOR-1 bacterium RIFOXYB2_FULL_37_13]OGC36834.1 MAG: pyridoxamine 5'-phosphate oxidase [candidate division WOR-1 bacterium RIFOXYC2_FULL_37_10]